MARPHQLTLNDFGFLVDGGFTELAIDYGELSVETSLSCQGCGANSADAQTTCSIQGGTLDLAPHLNELNSQHGPWHVWQRSSAPSSYVLCSICAAEAKYT